jgi:myo-inositol-1(or 4)-monophosphatase
MDPSSHSLSSWQQQTKECISETAAYIKRMLQTVKKGDVVEKEVNSLVSFVDQTAEKQLIAGLKKIIPLAGFVTEEAMTEQSLAEWTWVIDPLDGTTNFLHGIPFFSVSVALKHNGNTVMGIVHDIMHDEVFTAISGQGAYLNDARIQVTDRTDFHDILVGTGFPYLPENLQPGHLFALDNILRSTRGIRRLGSAALDLCQVACGRLGAFYETSLNEWDIAAGCLIVQEAGGRVTDFQGKKAGINKGEVLAAAPQVQQPMLDITNLFYLGHDNAKQE